MKLLISAILFCFVTGCGFLNKSEGKNSYCFDRNATLVSTGLGSAHIGVRDMEDLSECAGFRLISPGGEGNILRINGWGFHGIELEWQYNSLLKITLRRAWRGQVSQSAFEDPSGVRMGSSLDYFRSKYPHARHRGLSGWVVEYNGKYKIEHRFNFSFFGRKLSKIVVKGV